MLWHFYHLGVSMGEIPPWILERNLDFLQQSYKLACFIKVDDEGNW